MGSARTAPSLARLVTATGLVLGVGVGASTSVDASGAATSTPSGDCPQGTLELGGGLCQITFDHSGSWRVPAGVTKLSILAVGGGGGGGGGTTYGAGGGGGGGGVQICSTTLVDLTGPLAVTVGAGGAGGADGANNPNVNEGANHDEYGDAGLSGDETTVIDGAASKMLCGADGGEGGLPGYNYLVSQQVVGVLDSARPHGVAEDTYGIGGASGNNFDGGSAPSFTIGGCSESGSYEYNLTASGGGGAGAVGGSPEQGTSGVGGAGRTVTGGLFAGNATSFGGGGGGGAGDDCTTVDYPNVGGSGGGGNGGGPVFQAAVVSSTRAHARHGHEAVTLSDATVGTVNTGGGGGGGGGIDEGTGSPGAHGGSGVVTIRFKAPGVLNGAVYFATASSTLTTKDKSTLTSFVTNAIEDNKTTVTVKGYTDPRGSVPYNKALSKARAATVAAFVRALFASRHVTATVTAAGEGKKHTYKNDALDRVVTVSATNTGTNNG